MKELIISYIDEHPVKDETDINAMMRKMMSIVLEEALDDELDEEPGYSMYDFKNKGTKNSRNCHSEKTIHSSYGDMEIDIPRDRNNEFETQLIQKYQNTLTQDMENKILSMYAKGITQADICAHFYELYGVSLFESTISRITDKVLPAVKEWQEHPLEEVYAVVYLDTIHFHIRSEGRIVKKAVYIVLDLDMDCKKRRFGHVYG